MAELSGTTQRLRFENIIWVLPVPFAIHIGEEWFDGSFSGCTDFDAVAFRPRASTTDERSRMAKLLPAWKLARVV
jgi:hypothetical protein